jgi:hypothetical protein
MAPLLQYRLLPANYHLSQRLNIDNQIPAQNQIYPLTKTQHQQPNLCAKSITQSLFFHRGSKLNDNWNDSCVSLNYPMNLSKVKDDVGPVGGENLNLKHS